MLLSKTKVSKTFAANFEVVAAHYRLKELGEIEEAKNAAREDIENAEVCYALLAKEITG